MCRGDLGFYIRRTFAVRTFIVWTFLVAAKFLSFNANMKSLINVAFFFRHQVKNKNGDVEIAFDDDDGSAYQFVNKRPIAEANKIQKLWTSPLKNPKQKQNQAGRKPFWYFFFRKSPLAFIPVPRVLLEKSEKSYKS